jgi:hypothetical protein
MLDVFVAYIALQSIYTYSGDAKEKVLLHRMNIANSVQSRRQLCLEWHHP